MATLEDLRIADWAKPENANLAEQIDTLVVGLRGLADGNAICAARARDLADRLGALLGGWAADARWWLRDYRPAIRSTLGAYAPAFLD
jgi:hypothetical protein